MTTHSTQQLPPAPRRAASDAATPYRIAVVCLGNICRSPMADVVLNARLQEAGLGEHVEVVSAGTGDWHIGQPMDSRAAATLTAHGFDASAHRAQQIAADWLDEYDLILAMDASNFADITGLVSEGGDGSRVRMFRDFDPDVRSQVDSGGAPTDNRDVPDPYYGADDGFEKALAMIERTADEIVKALATTAAQSGSSTSSSTGSSTGRPVD